MKETRKISTLRLWDKNPRFISKTAFASLKKKIKRWGQFKPILITKDGEVVGGNMRLKAYQEMGIEDIWVSVVDPKNDAEKLEIAVTDNEMSGRWDEEKLAELVFEHKDNLVLSDYQIDLGKPLTLDILVSRYGPEPEEDEFDATPPDNPESVQGEVYQLGRHRLMCGDATSVHDVSMLMDGNKADMVFTDPPYNVDYEGYTKEKLKIKNDKMGDDEFRTLLRDSFASYNVSSKDGASMYVCHPSSQQILFEEELRNSGYSVRNQIIWAKNTFAWGMGRYKYQREPIFYCHKSNISDSWYGDKTQSTLWEVKKPSRNKEHPTMKPTALCSRAIKNSSKFDDIVLDLFGGSGSTLIACEQTNRVCYMMELDPGYCDVIRKRYAKLLGKEDVWQKTTTKIQTVDQQ